MMDRHVTNRDYLLERVETNMLELAALCHDLLVSTEPAQRKKNLTDELPGCLGDESLDQYDYSLDWQRYLIS